MTTLGDLETLTLGDCFTNMKLGRLPGNLRSITFGYECQDIDKRPTSLESLTFQPRVSQTETDLPGGLKHLTFGRRFNQSLDGMNLPSGLQSLTFDYHFNQSLDHLKLPSSLNSLKFGYCFDQTLDRVNLPSGLQSLTFGYNFNQSLDRVELPRGLQSLKFGYIFDQSLEQVKLPDGLLSLTFGYCFNQNLDHVDLPDSLQTLAFGCHFNQMLDHVKLPNHLQNLSFGRSFSQSLHDVSLPSGLKSLTLLSSFTKSLAQLHLPSLERLELGNAFCMEGADPADLPNLRELRCRKYFLSTVTDLPTSWMSAECLRWTLDTGGTCKKSGCRWGKSMKKPVLGNCTESSPAPTMPGKQIKIPNGYRGPHLSMSPHVFHLSMLAHLLLTVLKSLWAQVSFSARIRCPEPLLLG